MLALFASLAPTCSGLLTTSRVTVVSRSPVNHRHPINMVAAYAGDGASMSELLAERQIGKLAQRAVQEPTEVLQLLKDAGAYGIIAYGVVFLVFYSLAAVIGETAYHYLSGGWVDPRILLQDDGAEGKAEVLALLASFYLLCKPFAPIRLGGALLLTPDVKRFVKERPALVSLFQAVGAAVEPLAEGVQSAGTSVYRRVAPRSALKSELLALAAKSEAGIRQLSADDKERFDKILLRELPALCPMDAPTRSALFSGTWECRWTDEKELNFAVANGLFGLPWVRTYQSIDVPAGELVNIIEFEDGELRVGSSIAPDAADGTRFNFAFNACALTWRGLRVPLPPVGRGWGELLYLDDEMRIQRDIRGDMIVATKVRS